MDIKDVIKEVTENIQNNANVKAVFGEPYEKGKITVIPVSRVSICGFGGRGPGDKEAEDKPQKRPMGMGLRVKNTPAGYIEINDEEARFVEITDQSTVIKAGIALGVFAIFSFTRIFMRLLKD